MVISHICVALWEQGFYIEEIYKTLNISKRSVIARLSRQGVYKQTIDSLESEFFFY